MREPRPDDLAVGAAAWTRSERLLLAVVTLLGTALRLWLQHDRAFSGDEIGTLLYLRESVGFLLTHFIDPWLSMNFYLAFLKIWSDLFGTNRWVLMLPSLVAGVALIPAVALLGRRLASHRVALLAAAVCAFNPTLVSYSGVIRAYALALLTGTLTVIALVDQLRHGSRLNAALFGLLALVTFLLHLATLHFLFGCAAAALVWVAMEQGELKAVLPDRRIWGLGVAGLTACTLTLLLHLPVLEQIHQVSARYVAAPPTPVNYLPDMVSEFIGTRWAGLAGVLALLAAMVVILRRGGALMILLPIVAIPMLTTSLLGQSNLPWAATRYQLLSLPLVCVLLAFGALSLLRFRGAPMVVAIAAMLAWIPGLGHQAASHRLSDLGGLAHYPHAEDTLVPLQWETGHTLRAFLPIERLRGFDQYLREPLHVADNGRLVVLSNVLVDAHGFETTRFGHWQAVAIDGKTRWKKLARLYHWLMRITAGRHDANLSDAYALLLKLQPVVKPDEDSGRLTMLRCESLKRNLRERYAPPQWLGIPREEW